MNWEVCSIHFSSKVLVGETQHNHSFFVLKNNLTSFSERNKVSEIPCLIYVQSMTPILETYSSNSAVDMLRPADLKPCLCSMPGLVHSQLLVAKLYICLLGKCD